MSDISKPLPTNAQKWVDALRSGTYEKAVGALRVGDCFCALGVAADISGAKWTAPAPGFSCWSVGEHSETAALPQEVVEWLGFDPEKFSHVGVFDTARATTSSIMNLNDRRSKSFRDVATTIERVYEQWI